MPDLTKSETYKPKEGKDGRWVARCPTCGAVTKPGYRNARTAILVIYSHMVGKHNADAYGGPIGKMQ